MSAGHCGEFGLNLKSCWAVDIHDLAITGIGGLRYVFEGHASGLPVGETKCKNISIKAEDGRRIIRSGRDSSRAGNTFVRGFRNP